MSSYKNNPMCPFVYGSENLRDCRIIQGIHKRMVRFQKLTRNFSPYTGTTYTVSSFASATSSSLLMLTAGPVSKMAPQEEKAFCVLRFEVSRSVITVQREFRARFRKDAPYRNNITRWYRQFVETGCFCKGKSPGRPRV